MKRHVLDQQKCWLLVAKMKHGLRISGLPLLLLAAIALASSTVSAQQKNTDLDNCKGPVPDGAFNCKGTVWCDKGGTYMCCVPNKEGGRDCDQIEAKTGAGTKGVTGALRGNTLAPTTAQPKPPSTPVRQQGVIVNQLQAQPGFTLEQGGKKNQVVARKAGKGAGGLGASADCGCDSQNGTCTLIVTGGNAQCVKNPGNTCDGSCTFSTTQPSATGGIMMRK